MIRAEFFGFEGEFEFNYSKENIVYHFKPGGTLIVTGGENAGFPTGEYEYFFGEDHLGGGTTDPKVLLVKINSSKWTYRFSNGEMILGQSYVDGPDLFFQRR